MRLSRIVLPLAAFLLAGLVSLLGARAAVIAIEAASGGGVAQALAEADIDFATPVPDGLQLVLEGEAPSEALRFRAMSIAGSVVDASRVIDNMSVRRADALAAPDFVIELLRGPMGVSMIGLVPSGDARDALAARIADIADGAQVTDLLEVGDYPVPPVWGASVELALAALERAENAQISVSPGRVSVIAATPTDRVRARLESELSRLRPDGVRLALDVSAPRPVLTPYTLRFIDDADGARFDACAAPSEAARDEIVAAALSAGSQGRKDCTVAIGAPGPDWGTAAARAIAALDAVGGGTLTMTDLDVSAQGIAGTDPVAFAEAMDALQAALPGGYVLDADLPPVPGAQSARTPARFAATLGEDRSVSLRGRIPDARFARAAESYARAALPGADMTTGLRVNADVPPGWSVRVLAGLEALSRLSRGEVSVTEDALSVTGVTGRADARDAISRDLIARLGEGVRFDLSVTYDETLDPIAALPTPDECIAQINAVTAASKITFDPGSATIAGGSASVVDDIAEILRRCSDLRVRIAGYTDSQGSEDGNQALSERRAEAVLDALRLRRVPVGGFEAAGYGEQDPIATNDTPEGREANRRIEFTLLGEEGATPEPATEAAAAAQDEQDAQEAGE
ncbi:MAG: OmpA family protein [Paracoccaceae bacterium]